jgi:hypothetical protein
MGSLIRMALQIFCWFLLMPLVRALRGKERAPSDAFVSLWLCLVMVTVFFGIMAALGTIWSAPLLAAGMLLLMPWTVARRVLIPLGMSRSARFFSSLAGWTWSRDRRGGGLVAGAWAILHQKVPGREDMARLEAARDAAPVLSAAQVLATGLLAAARGDLESARALLGSVEELGARTAPTMVHALAREWLVADAAERGQWARVATLAGGDSGRAPAARTRATRLLGAVAARFMGRDDAPGTAWLWLLWLLAPCRRHSFALVRRARMAPARKGPTPAPVDHRLETTLRPDHYADALSAHVYALARDPSRLGADDLERLADAWDRALADPATRHMVMQRAAVLGARSGERVLHDLSETVARDIAGMARAAGVTLTEREFASPTLGQAQSWLHNELLGEIEIAFDALQIRVMDKRTLSSIDEWREWLSLRAVYARAAGLGGLELRRLAFPHVHHTVCKLAVWLWNQRDEHLMANAMFRWLLDEALAVGDAEAIELQSRNWDQKL